MSPCTETISIRSGSVQPSRHIDRSSAVAWHRRLKTIEAVGHQSMQAAHSSTCISKFPMPALPERAEDA